MKRALAFILGLLILSPLVFVPAPKVEAQMIGAGSASLSWLNPTQYTDGSPLVLNQIRIYRETNGAQIWVLIDTVPAGISAYVDDNLWNGDYCYAVTATDFANLESVRSNSACKTVNQGGNIPLPLAPTNLTVL